MLVGLLRRILYTILLQTYLQFRSKLSIISSKLLACKLPIDLSDPTDSLANVARYSAQGSPVALYELHRHRCQSSQRRDVAFLHFHDRFNSKRFQDAARLFTFLVSYRMEKGNVSLSSIRRYTERRRRIVSENPEHLFEQIVGNVERNMKDVSTRCTCKCIRSRYR